MSAPVDPEHVPAQLAALPGFPRDDAGPVFRAPWEAQAFALTLALLDRGAIGWREWTEALAQAIRDAQAAGDPDTGENYYRHWLVALERLSTAKGLTSAETLRQRRDDWDRAARATPHGKPIELAAAGRGSR